MKKDIPRDIGWIILFFPKDAIAQAKGVYVANVNERAVKDEVAAIVKRWSDQPRIILPGGD